MGRLSWMSFVIAAACTSSNTDNGSNAAEGAPTSLQSLQSDHVPRVDKAFESLASPDRRVERLLGMVASGRGLSLGFDVDLEEHAVQTASRAYWDGADEETVVASLMHDVGELMVPESHGDVAVALLRPYVSPRTEWMLSHHEMFQFYHYAGAYGVEDPDLPRARYRSSPYFRFASYWALAYDQASFDPKYESLPLRSFAPVLRRVLGRPPFWHPAQAADATNAGKLAITTAYPTSDLDSLSSILTLYAPSPPSAPLSSFLHDIPGAGTPWDASFEPQRFAYNSLISDTTSVFDFLRELLTNGLVLVEGMPTDGESVETLVDRALLPRQFPKAQRSFWDAGDAYKMGAYIFNFTNREDPDAHKGFVLTDLPAHNDGAYLSESPRVKVLHCHDHEGALPFNTFVDGYRAALDLGESHRLALQKEPILTALKNGTATTGMRAMRHVLSYDGDGRLAVVWNPHDRVDLNASTQLQGALQQLGAQLSSPRNTKMVQLSPGVAAVTDNWRVLHGRARVEHKTTRHMSGADLPDWSLRSKWREVSHILKLRQMSDQPKGPYVFLE